MIKRILAILAAFAAVLAFAPSPAQADPTGNMSFDEWSRVNVFIPNANTPPEVEDICNCTGFLAGLGYRNGNPSKVIEYTSYLGAGWSDVYYVLRDGDGKYHAWKKKICTNDGPTCIIESS
jgi:hypothetical protein